MGIYKRELRGVTWTGAPSTSARDSKKVPTGGGRRAGAAAGLRLAPAWRWRWAKKSESAATSGTYLVSTTMVSTVD